MRVYIRKVCFISCCGVICSFKGKTGHVLTFFNAQKTRKNPFVFKIRLSF